MASAESELLQRFHFEPNSVTAVFPVQLQHSLTVLTLADRKRSLAGVILRFPFVAIVKRLAGGLPI